MGASSLSKVSHVGNVQNEFAGSQIKIDGLKQLKRDLYRLDKSLLNDLKAVHKEASVVAAAAVSEMTPVRSGRLKKSVKQAATNKEGRIKAGTASRVPYAGVIHFGAPSGSMRNAPIRGQFYGYRGIKQVLPKILKIYEKGLADIGSKLGRNYRGGGF